jgi:hypothetical protein
VTGSTKPHKSLRTFGDYLELGLRTRVKVCPFYRSGLVSAANPTACGYCRRRLLELRPPVQARLQLRRNVYKSSLSRSRAKEPQLALRAFSLAAVVACTRTAAPLPLEAILKRVQKSQYLGSLGVIQRVERGYHVGGLSRMALNRIVLGK